MTILQKQKPRFSPFLAALAAISFALSTPMADAAGKDLAIVPAGKACADLAATVLSDIGGAGSKVTAAAEETSNNARYCAVDGILAPSVKFTVKLPVSTWTQRYMQLGCGGLCGNITLEAGAADL
jgi:Tannase and feruloyl esterase